MSADSVATYKCNDVGNITEAGGVSFRGGTIFETTSQGTKQCRNLIPASKIIDLELWL